MTYARITLELGLSPQRVQQIEARALKKLRRACLVLGLSIENVLPSPSRRVDPAIYLISAWLDDVDAAEFSHLVAVQTSALASNPTAPEGVTR